MAIVLISPKNKQRTFAWIAVTIILLLAVISLVVFIPKFFNKSQRITNQASLSQPTIAINLSIVDSDKVKNLEPFLQIEIDYAYVAQDQNGKQVAGTIAATSKDEAKKFLEALNLKVSSIKEANVGNSNPFISY